MAISEEAHSSVGKALHVIGVEPARGPAEATTASPAAALRAALDADPRRPTTVIGVVATAGTTNAGIVDDLTGVGRGRRASATCGSTSTPPTAGPALLRARRSGRATPASSTADSFIVDPHKWLFAPFDCAALLYREPRLARAVHTQDARLPRHPPRPRRRRRGRPWNPSDYAIHLTRRARGLPLWFSLAVHGTDAYRDAVETVLATARASRRAHQRHADYVELVPRARAVGGAVPPARLGGPDDYDEWSRRAAGRPGRLRHAHHLGGRAGGPASPSSTPTPRWRWWTRSSATMRLRRRRSSSPSRGVPRVALTGARRRPAPPPGHPRQRLEDDPVGQVRGDLGVVVGGRDLDHVDARRPAAPW